MSENEMFDDINQNMDWSGGLKLQIYKNIIPSGTYLKKINANYLYILTIFLCANKIFINLYLGHHHYTPLSLAASPRLIAMKLTRPSVSVIPVWKGSNKTSLQCMEMWTAIPIPTI